MTISCLLFPRISYFPRYIRTSGYYRTFLPYLCLISTHLVDVVPSGPPHDVRAKAKSSTEVLLSWEPPDRELWNGHLQGYYVSYAEVAETGGPTTGPGAANVKTVEVGAQYGGETLLQGLAMYTGYTVAVQAFNSRGAGPASLPVSVRTLEGGKQKWIVRN